MRHLRFALTALFLLFVIFVLPLSATERPRKTSGEALVDAAPAQAVVGIPSGRCLDVERANHAPETPVILYDCHDGVNQRWAYTSQKELRSLDGTMCLDVAFASTEPRALAQSYSCNGGANQKWLLQANGAIVSQQSQLCLTVQGGKSANGSRVDMWPCQGLPHQQWRVSPTGDTVAPTTPSAVSVDIKSCRAATVRWKPSNDNVGVAYYDIYHDGQLTKTVDGAEHEAIIDTTPGATWGIYINARDAAGNVSQASASVTLHVPQCAPDTIPPTLPSALQGSVNGTTVTLKWNASNDNVGVVAYDVFRNGVRDGSTSNLSFVDSGLPPNTSLQYAVAARDAQGNTSGPSVAITVHTATACTTAVCETSQLTTDTDIPWGLAQLPDGSVLYTRRDAHDVVKIDPDTGVVTSLGTVPNVESTDGEGGLLGLAVTPQFPASDPWVYLYHTSPTDNRIVRVKYVNGRLDFSTLQLLLTGIGRNKFHNGGRLRFGPDGKLYASVGDAQNGTFAQDIRSLSGKILRLNPDGSVPADNPFGNYVWSFGHRNPQGLAFDSSGRLWEQEFGNNVQDETNLIVKGGNYGWPDCEGTQSQSGQGCQTPGFIAPKFTYPTSEGSCSGLAIVRDVIYVACLRGTRMYRESIDGTNIGEVQQFFNGVYGRLRTVEPSNDGGLFLTTSNAGDKDSVPNNSHEKVLKVDLGQ